MKFVNRFVNLFPIPLDVRFRAENRMGSLEIGIGSLLLFWILRCCLRKFDYLVGWFPRICRSSFVSMSLSLMTTEETSGTAGFLIDSVLWIGVGISFWGARLSILSFCDIREIRERYCSFALLKEVCDWFTEVDRTYLWSMRSRCVEAIAAFRRQLCKSGTFGYSFGQSYSSVN